MTVSAKTSFAYFPAFHLNMVPSNPWGSPCHVSPVPDSGCDDHHRIYDWYPNKLSYPGQTTVPTQKLSRYLPALEFLKPLSRFWSVTLPASPDVAMALAREPATSNDSAAVGDYEAILSAIMATARGRRFLAEHARRSRQSDIELLNEVHKLTRGGNTDLFDFKALPEK